MARDPKLEAISKVALFAGMGSRELEEIARTMDEVDVPAGRVLMRQGDSGSEMFVVVSGRLRIEQGGHVISEVGSGAAVGEMALLSEGPRSATVTATEPSRLLVAGHREFHQLMDDLPSLRRQVLEGLATRIRAHEADTAH